MPGTRTPRRLAAILAADIAEYSRLVGSDEEGTIARVKALREEIIDPSIARHEGRVVRMMGDGLLVEFPSVVNAVQNAVEVQTAIAEYNADIADDQRITFRVGVNLGDILIDGDDILGDGVNIAARLESIAEPGGLCVSDVVHQSIEGKSGLDFEYMGERRLKNIAQPVRVWRWLAANGNGSSRTAHDEEQRIRFCTAPDGVNIAYATVGSGPPLVKAPNWMHHLEHDWKSPVWRHLLRALADSHTLVRFDQRGNGLSDWDPPEIGFETYVADLETVVDAAGVKRFPLLGISQGAAISIAYAVRHPERVSRLILYGGFAVGGSKRGDPVLARRLEAELEMIRQSWGQDNPAFRQYFTTTFMPGATRAQMDWFNELQRITASPENAARMRQAAINIDVRPLLAQVSVPTLVLHCREDGMVPFAVGRAMAAGIPGARFVPLDGRNHLILEEEPAWPRFLDEVMGFLAEDEAAT